MKTRTTLRDIAKVAKVHFTTVGLAIRGDSRVDPETSARILAAAKRLDYRPDPLLSALSTYRNRDRRVFHGNIGYLFTTPMNAVKTGFRIAYAAAREHADRLGFCLESFELSSRPNGPSQLQRVLHARGVQGMILSPLPQTGQYPELEWNRFAVATIGQSITAPLFHRAGNHQAHSMRHQLTHLRQQGYKRIGLVLSHNATIRTEHNFLGAYLAEQLFLSPNQRLDPLITDDLELPAPLAPAKVETKLPAEKSQRKAPLSATTPPADRQLGPWVKTARPDCIVASEPSTYDALVELGYTIPRDLGFSLVAQREDFPDLAGPVENWEMLGEAAVDIVISLLGKRDYGVPASPLTTLVGNKGWHTGMTLSPTK